MDKKKFILNNDNYYTQEANQYYMSVSQFKDFAGTLGYRGCESLALAKLNGYQEEKTTPLLVGGYVDAYFEGSLEAYKAVNPEIFTKDGTLKAPYQQANIIIKAIERQPYLMRLMSGEKQRIMTGEIESIPWKIKMDSYIPGKYIVDLKVMRSLHKSEWVKDFGKMSFVRYWGYDIQLAVYQEIVFQNTGERLPVRIVAAEKSDHPEVAAMYIEQSELDDALSMVRYAIPRIAQVKSGQVEPDRCESCDYCKDTVIIKSSVHHSELLEDI